MSLNMENCQTHGGGYKFSEILIFAWKLKIRHVQENTFMIFLT